MKMRYITLLCLTILFLTGCSKRAEPGSILAEVNGETLDTEAFIAGYGAQNWSALSSEQRKSFVEDWVNLTLLAQSAKERNLHKDSIVRQRMDFAQKKVLANALVAERLAEVNISEDQLFSYFRIHQADFQKPVISYNIQRIGLPDKLSAENLLQQINQGLDFSAAVRRYSNEDLRRENGMMGFVEAASADSVFWRAARQMEPMEVGVVSQRGDWYVFRYTESRLGDKEANFEDHRDEIRRRILSEKQEEIYRNLLLEIKSQNHNIYYY